MTAFSLKQKAGCLLLDVPRLLPALFVPGRWIRACNRRESLEVRAGGVDTSSVGPWSVDLHACRVFPWVGRRLMRQALRQWPIEFGSADKARAGKAPAAPEVSFVLPHRGRERLPLLTAVIESIFGQRGAAVECIVVEQSAARETTGLPPGVRYIHLPHPDDPIGWRKSWAYNVGVRAARAEVVVCHDADILVPRDYALQILRHIREEGYEVVHLQRFLFCLGRDDTQRVLASKSLRGVRPPERVRQNWQGGTVAIRRKSFLDMGGYDEGFVGWGGEDNEFFDRCRALPQHDAGRLPFVHLWHSPQPEKTSPGNRNDRDILPARLAVPRQDRIRDLMGRAFGLTERPAPSEGYTGNGGGVIVVGPGLVQADDLPHL